MKLLWELYFAFLRIGGLTFGGGLTMLPMLKYELVEKKDWITEEELLDCYAIGQCTPGIIAINTATFVGFKKKGVLGGIFSTLGMVTPSLVIITILAASLSNFLDNVWVQHALMGIRGVVCALMFNTVYNLAKKSLVNVFTCMICGIVLVICLLTDIPTVLIVIASAVLGVTMEYCSRRKHVKEPMNLDEATKDVDSKNIEEEGSKA